MKEFLVIETRVEGFLVTAEDYEDIIKQREAGKGQPIFSQFSCRNIQENGQTEDLPPPIVFNGVGTELQQLINKFGLHSAPGCKCNQHIVEMNQKGIEWCAQNIDTIVGWLREEAQRANLPFTEIGAKIMVKRAIHNAKKKATTRKNA